MKIVFKTRWKKCGDFRVQIVVREGQMSAIRQAWHRRIVIISRDDRPESPPTDS